MFDNPGQVAQVLLRGSAPAATVAPIEAASYARATRRRATA
jgi:hypothetical protein